MTVQKFRGNDLYPEVDSVVPAMIFQIDAGKNRHLQLHLKLSFIMHIIIVRLKKKNLDTKTPSHQNRSKSDN